MSRLTKKHFEAIAHALRDTNATIQTVIAIEKVLAETNPLFDKQKFWNAAVTLNDALKATEAGR